MSLIKRCDYCGRIEDTEIFDKKVVSETLKDETEDMCNECYERLKKLSQVKGSIDEMQNNKPVEQQTVPK